LKIGEKEEDEPQEESHHPGQFTNCATFDEEIREAVEICDGPNAECCVNQARDGQEY
jgi:hypothetical protein